MYRRILTSTLITFCVLAAGSAALAVANSVSTKPEPAFISHLDKSITDHPTPSSADDHGNDAVTSPTTADSTPTTIDDHGGDTTATTPVTIDDHGNGGTGGGADGSGSGSGHSGGADDSSGSNHG